MVRNSRVDLTECIDTINEALSGTGSFKVVLDATDNKANIRNQYLSAARVVGAYIAVGSNGQYGLSVSVSKVPFA